MTSCTLVGSVTGVPPKQLSVDCSRPTAARNIAVDTLHCTVGRVVRLPYIGNGWLMSARRLLNSLSFSNPGLRATQVGNRYCCTSTVFFVFSHEFIIAAHFSSMAAAVVVEGVVCQCAAASVNELSDRCRQCGYLTDIGRYRAFIHNHICM